MADTCEIDKCNLVNEMIYEINPFLQNTRRKRKEGTDQNLRTLERRQPLLTKDINKMKNSLLAEVCNLWQKYPILGRHIQFFDTRIQSLAEQ